MKILEIIRLISTYENIFYLVEFICLYGQLTDGRYQESSILTFKPISHICMMMYRLLYGGKFRGFIELMIYITVRYFNHMIYSWLLKVYPMVISTTKLFYAFDRY